MINYAFNKSGTLTIVLVKSQYVLLHKSRYKEAKTVLYGFFIINYRFLTTETNLKAIYLVVFFYNLISKAICSDCTDYYFCMIVFDF